MAFNLFGPPTKNDIRVGYIDPDLGYVEGFTICQANEYAIKNPGTTFIFRNGNNVVQYLNINEVNQLDPNVLVSTDECGGINQKKECGPPTIQFFGGGGIGAAGNPIIGRDGALLAIDIVRGGNGYQYPPIVAARDNCNYGTGATLTAVLGEVTETIETYENESDFEDYELCDPNDIGYGRKYGPDGEDLGPWEPRIYTDPGEDPIRNEIEEYEKIIRRLARSPFWSTRTAKPIKITCSNQKIIPSKYNVTFPAWNSFMNSYAISPVSPSNVRGSDFAANIFTFEWVENFPLDGEYIFRGLCDNNAQLYIDNIKVANLSGFNAPVTPIRKAITKGIHNIRIDLSNAPIYETIEQPNSSLIDVTFNVYGQGKNTKKINFAFISEDGSHSFVIKGVNQSRENRSDVIKVKPNTNYKVVASTSKPKSVVEQGIIKNNKKNKEGGLGSSNKIFADHLSSANDNDDMQITSNSGIFTSKNKKSTPQGRSTFDLNFKVESTDSTTSVVVKTIVSPKSWNQNPMGVSMTIDAPEPTVPKEPVPVQEGRCPPNPIWTTRFPNAKENWYPVKFDVPNTWSKFMNRYAISPVKPLDTPGSDTSGATFSNSWDIDIPYDGFYGVQGTRDNNGRILIDGTEVSRLDGFNIENPDIQKVFITKGRHTIGVEVFNEPVVSETVINRKIFRTKDWQVKAEESTKTVDVDFNVKGVASSTFASSFEISDLGINISKPSRTSINKTVAKKVEVGKVYTIKIKIPRSENIKLKVKGKTLEVEDLKSSTARDLFVTISNGKFFDIKNGAPTASCKFIVEENGESANIDELSGGTSKDGVTYDGPPLFSYKDKRWGNFMNNHSVSPFLPPIDSENREIAGLKKYTWKNVNFPESGQYDIAFQADNTADLYIGGVKVLSSQGFSENPQTFKVNVTEGKYDIVVECNNIPERNNIFRDNPTGFGIVISKNVTLTNTNTTPWSQNPIGISAILIPPPCPRKIRGRGVVVDVVVNDPGNGYLKPIPSDQGYPVALRLKEVIVENPGINYNCGVDELIITPSNGAELDYVCDPFGKIREVKVLNPGLGFTEYPEIRLISETGVNASFRPVFEVVRDPIVLPERLIQVTDLVGLKQTGYVNGRPYYGAVYYDQGVRFAGFYETVGEPVRVYDTLQESITAEVTTPPSAIQRQGTDITSNDPRLNIPGTPQDLI